MSEPLLLVRLKDWGRIRVPTVYRLPVLRMVMENYFQDSDIDKKEASPQRKIQTNEDHSQNQFCEKSENYFQDSDIDRKKDSSKKKIQTEKGYFQFCEQSDVKLTADKALTDDGHAEEVQQNEFQSFDIDIHKFDDPHIVNAATAYKRPSSLVKKSSIIRILRDILLASIFLVGIFLTGIFQIIGGAEARAIHDRAKDVYCGPGEQYNYTNDGCDPCKKDTWTNKSNHRDMTCELCSYKGDYQHSFEVSPCTPTSDTVLKCLSGYVDVPDPQRKNKINCEKAGRRPNKMSTTLVPDTSTTKVINGSIADTQIKINDTSTSGNVTSPNCERPIDDGKKALALLWLIVIPAIILAALLCWTFIRRRHAHSYRIMPARCDRIPKQNDPNEDSCKINIFRG